MLPNGIYIGLTSNKFDVRHPGTYLSRIIQIFSKSIWNHAVLIVCLPGLSVVVHAQAWVRLEVFDDWCRKTDRTVSVYQIVAPVERLWLLRQLNKIYDVWGLICQALLILSGKWFGRKGTRNDNTFFCSELAVRLLNVPDAHLYKPSDIPRLTKEGKISFTGLFMTKKGLPVMLPIEKALKAV